MRNSGFKVAGHARQSDAHEQHIVVGVGRGGTSAMASALNALGIYQGRHVHPPNYEDVEISQAFRAGRWREFKRLVGAYAAEHAKFAWKLPDSNRSLGRVHGMFPNPSYIIVYRDVFAIANRRALNTDGDIVDSMQASLDAYSRIVTFVRRKQPRVLHVSYEKVLQDPRSFARELATYCAATVDDALLERVSDAIRPSPPEYLEWCDTSRQTARLQGAGFDGCIDELSDEVLAGWLLGIGHRTPVVAEVVLNGEIAEVFTCDQPREDLVKAGKSATGRAGFRLTLPRGLVRPNDVIEVRPQGCAEGLLKVVGPEVPGR